MEGSVIGAVNVTNDYWRSVWAIGQKEKYEGKTRNLDTYRETGKFFEDLSFRKLKKFGGIFSCQAKGPWSDKGQINLS